MVKYRLYLDGVDAHGAKVERVVRVWVLVAGRLATSCDVVDIQVALVDGVCRSHYVGADAIYADLSVDIGAAFRRETGRRRRVAFEIDSFCWGRCRRCRHRYAEEKGADC